MKISRPALWAAVVLSLCSLGWAEPKPDKSIRRVVINTEPAGAQVKSYNGNVLGKSGEPIDFDTNQGSNGQLELSLELEGYEPAPLILKFAGVSPDGRFPVKPLSLRSTGTPYLPLALGSLAVGLGGLGWFVSRRNHKSALEAVDVQGGAVDHGSLAGIVLGRFRLVERVGAGGMATVYRALPSDSNNAKQTVAIKIMRKELTQDREMLERFKRECKHTAELSHPNIVRMEDWGQQDELVYLVLEWISGGDLRSRFTGAVAVPDVWDVLEPLCSAIQFAHNRGIVHRDLKPENIMVTQSGLVKVSDFGLARAGQVDKVTATGAILGTPAYMAPEQIQGVDPVPSMDQYAIGIIAYELLTGRLPFVESDTVQLIFKTISQPPPPPSQFRQLSPEIDAVILKMLSKNPDDRYATVELAAKELKQVLLAGVAAR